MPLDQSPVWPTDAWSAHLGDREDGKSVRDEVAPFREWWLLMAGQGQPATPEQKAALQEAHRIITTFTGMALPRTDRPFGVPANGPERHSEPPMTRRGRRSAHNRG